MLSAMAEFTSFLAAALYLADLAIKVVALGVIPGNRRPSTGMAWLLLILAIPFVGFLVFLLLGSTRLRGKRHLQQQEVNQIVAERTAHLPPAVSLTHLPPYVTSASELNRNLGALPSSSDNDVKLFRTPASAML